MTELRTILPFARPYRAGILFGFLLIVASNVFGIIVPDLIGRGVDAAEHPGATLSRVLYFGLLIVGATLVSGAARFGMRQLLNGISRRIEVDLRDRFVEHLLTLDAGFFGRERTGDLMSRATNDTTVVRQAIGPGVMYLVNTLVLTALCLVRMITTSGTLTLVTLAPLVLLPPVVLRFGRTIHDRSEDIQNHLGELSNFVQENLSGVRIVRAYVQERHQEEEFEALNASYFRKNMSLARTSSLFHPVITVFAGLSMVALLWVGGRLVIAGEVSKGSFIAFGFYLALMTWPMIALGWVTDLFQRGAASMKRINRILRAQPDVKPAAVSVQTERLQGALEFKNVSFRYPGSQRDVLRNVSFRIEPGATLALVGPTGSGKSTAVALMARLYDVTSGEIRLDDVPITQIAESTLRRDIAVVPQDAFVFSETIEENIAMGDTSPDALARVSDAARVARLHETVLAFPKGYQTRLGERGVNLSGGQRQRTTLARAIARDPAILILDDALSAVDTHTEAEILNGLRDVLARRTAVLVSHRVTAVMNADLILVLEDGRIVETGRHAELIERGGVYASLLRRQLLEETLEEDSLAASSGEG